VEMIGARGNRYKKNGSRRGSGQYGSEASESLRVGGFGRRG